MLHSADVRLLAPPLALTCTGRSRVRVCSTLEPRADAGAADPNTSSALTCGTYTGLTASSAPQRRMLRNARSERLTKLVKRMMAEREAELRAASA